MQQSDSSLETWVLRLLAGTILTLFFTWLVSRIREVEKNRDVDQKAIGDVVGRIAIVETEVKNLSESESRNSQAIKSIAESTQRIESALLGYGGKGGLINSVEVLTEKVQGLTNNHKG